jgi:hypothetical protein
MNINDETLSRYLDGELDVGANAEVEAALRSDVALAARAAEQRALRGALRAHFDAALAESVPLRLLVAARGAKRLPFPTDAGRPTRRGARIRPGWAWPAVAATLVAALLLTLGPRRGPAPSIELRGGTLYAAAALEQVLSTRLGGDPVAVPGIRLNLSFKARSGTYCRVFSAPWREHTVTGIACRDTAGWRIDLPDGMQDSGSTADGLRQAATELTPALLARIDADRMGEPLDAEQEAQARERGWRP